MQEHKTDFISVNENFDTSSPMGMDMMGILIVFAQVERESIQERLEQNEQIKRSNAESSLQELAGLLKCKGCGYAVKSYSKSTNGRPYLACYGRYGLKTCDVSFKGVRFEDIQNAIAVEMCRVFPSFRKRENSFYALPTSIGWV